MSYNGIQLWGIAIAFVGVILGYETEIHHRTIFLGCFATFFAILAIIFTFPKPPKAK